MEEFVKGFEQWLTEEGKADKTVESYTNDIRKYHQFLEEKAGSNDQPLTRFSFVRYKQYLIDNQFAMSTINKKVNSLKVYNDFLQKQGVVNESYIQLKRDRVKVAAGSEKEVEAMSEQEVERLLFYLENHRKVSIRNKLIAYLLLYSGVRVSELVNIKLVDIDKLTSTLKFRGKGGKIREIGLRQDVLHLIDQYQQGERKESRFSESEYLLVSQRRHKMHRDAVRNWLAKISDDVGVKLHPHKFRHTFCTMLLKKGVPLTTVSRLAGHSNVNITASTYIHQTREEKLEAVHLL